MNIKNILNITKDVLTKACIYFTAMILVIISVSRFLNTPLRADTCFMFALASLGAGISVQVFKLKKLNLISRHTAFFILLYLCFLLVFIPLSQYTMEPNSVLYLSTAFVIIYAVILGIVTGIKAIVNSVKNKRLKYDSQFKI
ncbi:MAG: hypothetical protein FWH10_06280 [Oscillospiraceae bacterium]|nr:hypothetical protein [Oscillospiraceae bacterium]